MSQADAEDGNLTIVWIAGLLDCRMIREELLDVLLGVRDGGRVCRAVREEHPVGFHLQNLFRRRLRRHNSHPRELRQTPEDVRLHAEVVADDMGEIV